MNKQTHSIQGYLPCAGLVLALAASVGPPPAQAAAPAEKNWLKDPITGCAVWTEKTEGQEVISWSGGCRDGKASGRGVLSWFSKAKLTTRFEGTMVAGKAEGLGQLDFWLEPGYAH